MSMSIKEQNELLERIEKERQDKINQELSGSMDRYYQLEVERQSYKKSISKIEEQQKVIKYEIETFIRDNDFQPGEIAIGSHTVNYETQQSYSITPGKELDVIKWADQVKPGLVYQTISRPKYRDLVENKVPLHPDLVVNEFNKLVMK